MENSTSATITLDEAVARIENAATWGGPERLADDDYQSWKLVISGSHDGDPADYAAVLVNRDDEVALSTIVDDDYGYEVLGTATGLHCRITTAVAAADEDDDTFPAGQVAVTNVTDGELDIAQGAPADTLDSGLRVIVECPASYDPAEITAEDIVHDPAIVKVGVEEPVGAVEIAARLDVQRATVDRWRQRDILPAPEMTVGGRPAWWWSTILRWARATGRA